MKNSKNDSQDRSSLYVIAAFIVVIVILMFINYSPEPDVNLEYQLWKETNQRKLDEEAEEAHKLYEESKDRRRIDPVFER